jgi:protein-tyrosine phosphatase
LSLFDIHNHMIPGVDDGARDVAEAVTALLRLADAGATAVLTTPHFDGSLTLDPTRQRARLDALDRGWAELLAAPGLPDMELYRGAEIMLDVPDPRPTDQRLRIAGGPFVLVEFPHMTIPPGATRPLDALRTLDLIPVLAHPERYHGGGPAREDVIAAARSWRSAGAYLQVNGPSLVGRYGDAPRKRAMALLEAGLVDFIGSDYHARGQTMIPEYRALFGDGDEEAWTLLTSTNPRRMVEGKPPLPVPPARPGRAGSGRSWPGATLLGRLRGSRAQ